MTLAVTNANWLASRFRCDVGWDSVPTGSVGWDSVPTISVPTSSVPTIPGVVQSRLKRQIVKHQLPRLRRSGNNLRDLVSAYTNNPCKDDTIAGWTNELRLIELSA